MARKNVKNPQKFKNQYAQKAYDMHHVSTRSSFCGIGYGAVETKVDPKAAAVTGAVIGSTVAAVVVTPKVPMWAQVAWASVKAVFTKKP